MSSSTIRIFSLVLVSSLLLTACSLQAKPQPSPTITPMEQTDATQNEVIIADPNSTPAAAVAGTNMTASTETSYMSPGGQEKVSFTLTVDETGTITDAKTEVLAKNPTSIVRQKSFAAEFSTALTGKKLSSLTDIDRLGGSSLTTLAFNKALEELKAQI